MSQDTRNVPRGIFPTTDAPDVRLLSAESIAELLGISERTLWRLLSAGRIPEPVRIGRNTRWRLSEVRDWIARGCPVKES
jgi:excisionase family DNA binding protein